MPAMAARQTNWSAGFGSFKGRRRQPEHLRRTRYDAVVASGEQVRRASPPRPAVDGRQCPVLAGMAIPIRPTMPMVPRASRHRRSFLIGVSGRPGRGHRRFPGHCPDNRISTLGAAVRHQRGGDRRCGEPIAATSTPTWTASTRPIASSPRRAALPRFPSRKCWNAAGAKCFRSAGRLDGTRRTCSALFIEPDRNGRFSTTGTLI